VRNPFSSLSRATKVMIALGAVLTVVAATGALSSDRSVSVPKEQAVEIAHAHVDFEPEVVRVRLVRQGFRSAPYWAVSLSVPDPDGGSARVATVLVSASDGAVAEVNEG